MTLAEAKQRFESLGYIVTGDEEFVFVDKLRKSTPDPDGINVTKNVFMMSKDGSGWRIFGRQLQEGRCSTLNDAVDVAVALLAIPRDGDGDSA